jgi:hypothetical protein
MGKHRLPPSSIVVLPSNESEHGPQRTQLLLLCVRWNVYTESLPTNGYMRHNLMNRPPSQAFRGSLCNLICAFNVSKEYVLPHFSIRATSTLKMEAEISSETLRTATQKTTILKNTDNKLIDLLLRFLWRLEYEIFGRSKKQSISSRVLQLLYIAMPLL